MKRFHIHIVVKDLEQSISFYSNLFGDQPTVQKTDYAKWMLEDPKVNFAISTQSDAVGIEHLGIQVESSDELDDLRGRLKQTDIQLFAEGETVCCYAKSDKSWVEDPSGIAWETYHTMAEAQFFKDNTEASQSACCTPQTATVQISGLKK